jgi:hypothetical protein
MEMSLLLSELSSILRPSEVIWIGSDEQYNLLHRLALVSGEVHTGYIL